MQAFSIKLIPLSLPRKLSSEESLHASDCPSKEETADEDSETFLESLKERIEEWSEEHKSAVFRKCIAERRRNCAQKSLQTVNARAASSLDEIVKVKEECERLRGVIKARASANGLENEKATPEIYIAGKDVRDLDASIGKMYILGDNK
eukprot:TRINITY_DN6452_c0_g4_i4.p1 TRINITY_DN6452_c0_g4~~TRINITY_DN6452_c0_g4_i4.p1  ORF type:complete len:149 (-),score=36.61 TRINITY_DN6452_c0_g4_i4:407-853(-)